MNDRDIHGTHQRQHRAGTIRFLRVVDCRAQRHIAEIQEQHDEFRGQSGVAPFPPGAPHRPAPDRPGGECQEGEPGSQRRGAGRYGMSKLHSPDQADAGGYGHRRIREHRQVCRWHVDVDDSKSVALLIVGRGQKQSGICPVGNQCQRRNQEPGNDLRCQIIEMGRRCELMKDFPHRRQCYSLLILRAAAVANGAKLRANMQ